jgi:MFS family permease
MIDRTAAGTPEAGKSEGAVSWRIQTAVYGIGTFSTSVFSIGSVITPLYAYTMNPSPLLFGLVFSAAHVLPLLFSIHGGALMDRLGARRVMLACSVIGALLPLLYPLAPGIWGLVILQMFLGLSESTGWIGAQTMIGQYMHGKTSYAGRLSLFMRIGQLAAPPMAGAAWDMAGAWGAYAMMALWASGSVFCALLLPAHAEDGPAGEPSVPRGAALLRILLPSLSDYVTAFRLLTAPAVTLVVLLGASMHLGNSVQSSFYVAWLDEMGITGTAIGLLSPVSAIAAALVSLLTAKLVRYISGFWILLVSLWAGVIFICITPLLGTYVLLQVAMFLRSAANGLAQPLVITLVLRGAGRTNQGKAIGLRGTANRIASILSPLAMGAIAEAVGLEISFYVIGLFATVLMGGIALYLWRRPDVAKAGED